MSFYASVTAAAVLWGALRGHANILFTTPRMVLPSSLATQLLSNAALGVALGLLLVLLTRELQERFTWARLLHNEFRQLLGPLRQHEILLLAAASAIGEECLFRGALQSHLSALAPGSLGMPLGILGSAAIFALLHIAPGLRFLSWTVSALVMGIVLGGLFAAMGDLMAPIAVHFTVNLLNLQDIVRRQLPST